MSIPPHSFRFLPDPSPLPYPPNLVSFFPSPSSTVDTAHVLSDVCPLECGQLPGPSHRKLTLPLQQPFIAKGSSPRVPPLSRLGFDQLGFGWGLTGWGLHSVHAVTIIVSSYLQLSCCVQVTLFPGGYSLPLFLQRSQSLMAIPRYSPAPSRVPHSSLCLVYGSLC